jgi:hypothetical protein
MAPKSKKPTLNSDDDEMEDVSFSPDDNRHHKPPRRNLSYGEHPGFATTNLFLPG